MSIANRIARVTLAAALMVALCAQITWADPDTPGTTNVTALLASAEFSDALNAGDWEKAIGLIPEDSSFAADPRVLLLIGHAQLAQNSNNTAYTIFSIVIDSASLDAWEAWTADLAASHPEAATAHYLCGDALARQAKLDLAIEEFTAAIDKDGSFHLALNARGVALAMKWLELGEEGTKYKEDALVDFQTAARIDTTWADPHANHGALQIQAGHAESVERAYGRAIDRDPSYALAHNGRSCALAKLKRIGEASYDLIRADSLQPGIPFVALNAVALAESADPNSRIVELASTVPEGMSFDSLEARGSWSVGFNYKGGGVNLSDVSWGDWHGNLGQYTVGEFSVSAGVNDKGGVYFDGVEVSETGEPQKVGTGFLLNYPCRRPEAADSTKSQ